ncbi:hypothetical protein Syun_002176 [Stephania yunnanensis]|uniref:Uncharacterized protein n=1 Tax=Stephania yunnanensis TaxID=152371 RepID=A0AAP0QBL1_9MAGN
MKWAKIFLNGDSPSPRGLNRDGDEDESSSQCGEGILPSLDILDVEDKVGVQGKIAQRWRKAEATDNSTYSLLNDVPTSSHLNEATGAANRWAKISSLAIKKLKEKVLFIIGDRGSGKLYSNFAVRDDVVAAYKKGMEWKASKMLLPYKQLCSEKKVEAEIVQIEADDVPVAISNEVSKSQISMLVIGASSGGVSQGKSKRYDIR